MQELESAGTTNEGISAQEANEWIGATEVCNFEGCEAIKNEQLADYIRETIPLSHLEGCPRIEYDPEHAIFVDSPDTLGFYECDSHAIHIGGNDINMASSEGLLDTVTHEIGHNAYDEMKANSPQLADKWEQINADSQKEYAESGFGFVSGYARTNQYEDFAESYKAYIRDPELLQMMSNDKYEFMHQYVFHGREYQLNDFVSVAEGETGSVIGKNDVMVTGGDSTPYRCFDLIASS